MLCDAQQIFDNSNLFPSGGVGLVIACSVKYTGRHDILRPDAIFHTTYKLTESIHNTFKLSHVLQNTN